MKKQPFFVVFKAWFYSRRWVILYTVMLFIIIFAVYSLYLLPWQPATYTSLLGLVMALMFAIFDFIRFAERHAQLSKLVGRFPTGQLPQAKNMVEQDAFHIIEQLENERIRLVLAGEQRQKQAEEYYTTWVHQIKTPISAMNLVLQQQNGKMEEPVRTVLQNELFRTEQYVGMVLQYLRLETMNNDLVLRRYPVETLVKKAVKNLAPLFIYKKLPLRIELEQQSIVTDEKWFVFVLEQLLSNALKYTGKGEVHVYMQPGNVLVVEDTGIGIAPEDLPMVFERGFTGNTGRANTRSTGIGLYLSKEIMNRLGFGIYMESQPGKGTRVMLNLAQHQLEND